MNYTESGYLLNTIPLTFYYNGYGDWKLELYFPGPDRRFNPDCHTINNNDIENIISGIQINLPKYYELKKNYKGDGEHIFDGDNNMRIFVGGYLYEGVCWIYFYHKFSSYRSLFIDSDNKLNKLIAEFNQYSLLAKKLYEEEKKTEQIREDKRASEGLLNYCPRKYGLSRFYPYITIKECRKLNEAFKYKDLNPHDELAIKNLRHKFSALTGWKLLSFEQIENRIKNYQNRYKKIMAKFPDDHYRSDVEKLLPIVINTGDDEYNSLYLFFLLHLKDGVKICNPEKLFKVKEHEDLVYTKDENGRKVLSGYKQDSNGLPEFDSFFRFEPQKHISFLEIVLSSKIIRLLSLAIIIFAIISIFFNVYTNYKQEREYDELQRYWEEVEITKQRENDSIEAAKLEKRRLVDSAMVGNVTVIGDIRLGQTVAEYNAAVSKIKKELGYAGITIKDVRFLLTSPKYYKGKLYRVTLQYEDYYNYYEYDDGIRHSYRLDEKFKPLDCITNFLVEKYGPYDKRESMFAPKTYTFTNKRILWDISVKNINKYISYNWSGQRHRIATITFEDPKIADLLENQRLEKIKQEEQRKAQEKERKEQERKRKEEEQKRKEEELLKNL